jgi:hypothetical protein
VWRCALSQLKKVESPFGLQVAQFPQHSAFELLCMRAKSTLTPLTPQACSVSALVSGDVLVRRRREGVEAGSPKH